MAQRVKVGLIGVGKIAPAYIKGCSRFPILEIVACADLDQNRAQAFAKEYGLQAYTVEELLAAPDVQIVINLTIPAAHAEVNMAIINAGKHAYAEKPLAVFREDGKRAVEAARSKGVLVGCAPDTFLGGGGQTARKLIDEGVIGEPVAATEFMAGHGPEGWHPNPDFYYQTGGGPLFDMGPYYLTALINLMGPISRVTGSARMSFAERTISNPNNRFGEKIKVEVPTHHSAVLDFAAGAVATLITSFDVWQANLPRIEIYGSEGTLSVPDPNTFGGKVSVWLPSEKEWREVPLAYPSDLERGIGVADMAYALQSGRPHRASGDLAYHVLDVMHSIEEASQNGTHSQITSQCAQPTPLPVDLPVGELDI